MSRRPAPPPGFTLDDDDEEEIPAPPAGFQLVPPAKPEPAAAAPVMPWYGSVRNAPKLSEPLAGNITSATDGDTLRTDGGGRVRLYGVDAPELKQTGWDRQGRAVPIGQQSRAALAADLGSAESIIGQPAGQSFGRVVAPVKLGGSDLGQKLARAGEVLAAPRYMANDPQRRFDYMQAERLARQNGLGIHDTMFQSPEQFRRDPMPTPSREQVAQFWDTPTPLAGMRADAEQRYLAMVNDPKIAPAAIQAFALENGFRVPDGEVERVREESRKSGKPVGVAYQGAPKPLTDQGDGMGGAIARGLGQGFAVNQLEELGALPDTLGLTGGRENVWNSDRRFADIFANNLQQNESITGFDRSEYPGASLASEVAGGLVMPMGRVRNTADLAKWGAAYGAIAGLGQEGTIPERLTSGAIGGGVGLGATVLGGKALEAGIKYAPRLAERVGLRSPGPVADVPAAPAVGFPGFADDVAEQAAPRVPDFIDIGDVPPPPPGFRMDSPAPIDTSYPGPVARPSSSLDDIADADVPQMRDRDWIDISQVPPPPAGYRLDQPREPAAMAMDAEPMASVSQAIPRQPDYLFAAQPQRMDQPLADPQRRAIAEGVDPRDVLPILSNELGSVEEAAAIQAGRYAPARPVDESQALASRTVQSQNGRPLPKRGPLDLVTWLRTQGGIRDQGGELRAMGIDNAGRDLDFARGEQRFGRLVDNETGMNLDDAALRAWEAGYLPGNDRPDINQFLDAVGRTHGGAERFFHPDDLPEVAQFEGMRADRMALEEQLADGPVYQDRSMPASEPQPFPPVQAYEEWPAGGPDFAGNIRLDKLETPQDITRALDMTSRRVGFDAATRGRISHAETERLAADLGMTPDSLIARRKGQSFNAEEALAARQILAKSGNELVNAAKRMQGLEDPGHELLAEFRQKWMRHAAIQEQVSGMTAEAGRALQAFRMAANSGAVRGDVLSSLVRGGGGKERIQDAADLLLDAIETSPGKFNAEVERLAKPQFRDKVTELYINSLLTNPATHVVNMVSNTLTSLAQIPEHAVAATIGKGRQMMPGADIDRVIGSEIGQRAFGLLQGAKEGARFFWQALKTGEPADFVSKVENQSMKAISGLKGEIARIPTRLLTAEDEFFKGIARRMELNGLAARQAHLEGLSGQAAKARIAELSEVPTDEMLQGSMNYARYLTFQQQLGPAMSKLSGMTQDFRPLKLFLPFIRTPTNLLKFALERSPAAPLLKEWRTDFQAGGAKRDLAIAKVMIGTGMGMAIYEAAENGLITGSPPTDQAQARLFYADGKQPYSIRVGDEWLSYKRLDPFSTTLGVAADMALLPAGMSDRQREDMGTLLVASILGNLASKTWLSGLSGLIGAVTEPDRKADDLLQRVVGGIVVPAGVAQLARITDPVARETDSVGEAVQARLPGLSNKLQPRIDVWGRPKISEGGIGPDIISPIYKSTAREDPVNRELSKLGYAPGPLRREVGGRKLTPQEYTRYQMAAGSRSHAALQALIGGPGWKALDVEAKEGAAKDVVADARKAAKAELFGAPRTSGLMGSATRAALRNAPRKSDVPAPPPGYSIEGEAGGRNVYQDLRQAIPGVRFTSGFRTPEYQADMRRRGYKPASNSQHLDGTALDMLPPPGKSMDWLRGEVRRYDPDARLLIHDGHLHGTFPGYFGAPVLGGARSAGLRNPNEGMPPPPPGFKLNR